MYWPTQEDWDDYRDYLDSLEDDFPQGKEIEQPEPEPVVEVPF